MISPASGDPKIFLFGGLSCQFATLFTNPIDVVKTRMQLSGELSSVGGSSTTASIKRPGIFTVVQTLAANEGPRSFYRGLTASILREALYSSTRMGLYEPFKELLAPGVSPSETSLTTRIVAGGFAGALGALVSNPTDLVRVRMQVRRNPCAPVARSLCLSPLSPQADPKTSQHKYAGTMQAFRAIGQLEGIRGLWKGTVPNMQRAAILTASQLSSYDAFKHAVLDRGLMCEGLPLHSVSSIFAGTVCALTTAPVDNVKTRLMNQMVDAAGQGLMCVRTRRC